MRSLTAEAILIDEHESSAPGRGRPENPPAFPSGVLERSVDALLVVPASGYGLNQGKFAHGTSTRGTAQQSDLAASANTLIIVLILLLLGALPTWGYSRSWGYFPSGGLGLILVIIIVLVLMGRI